MASKLGFGTQPSSTGAGSPITPAVTVQILDANGNLTSSTASVTVAIGTNPAGGTLSGTLTKAAVNGVATFSNLSLDKPGTGYTLTAASTGLTGATSSPFNITAGAASRLVFGTQPSSVPVGAPITPAVTVQILDALGNLTTSTASVTMAIGTNPGGGTLSGTVTRAAVAGVATFNDLSINKAGTGYTLTASSTGLTGATSSPFDIGAATKILVETKSDGTGVVVPAQSLAYGVSLNVYAISRDANNAFVANVAPDSWSLASLTGGVVVSDLVAAGAFSEFSLPWVPSQPSGIAAGPDGNVWFTEANNNKVGRITPAGVVTEFQIPSLSSSPGGIAAGPDGNLWFLELGGRIGRITPAGAITEFIIPTASSLPYYIAAGPDGNLWFTEYGGNRIGRITTAGAVTEFTIPTGSSQPYGIAAGPDANLWFTEYSANKIGRITPAGVVTEFAIPTASSQPSGIGAGPDGNLWFTEYAGNKIGRITTAGVVTEFSVPTASSYPYSVVAGPDGNLWFTEYAGNKLGKISTTGVITELMVPTGSSQPRGIALGADHNLWFTEYNGNKIGRLGTSTAIADGRATFTAHKAGTASIHAAKFGMTSTDSGTLTVTAGPATKLAFLKQPSQVAATVAIYPAVTVQIVDVNGNVITSSANVSMTIAANPGSGTLSGTKTVAAVNGVATFSDLSINKSGVGYTLKATCTGLTNVNSMPFNVNPGAATKIRVETANDGTGIVVPAQNIPSGSSLTVYAISRDANNNFVGNVTPDSWSLTGKTGGVVAGDLVPGEGFAEFSAPSGHIPWSIAAGLDGQLWYGEINDGASDQFLGSITTSGSTWDAAVASLQRHQLPSSRQHSYGVRRNALLDRNRTDRSPRDQRRIDPVLG